MNNVNVSGEVRVGLTGVWAAEKQDWSAGHHQAHPLRQKQWQVSLAGCSFHSLEDMIIFAALIQRICCQYTHCKRSSGNREARQILERKKEKNSWKVLLSQLSLSLLVILLWFTSFLFAAGFTLYPNSPLLDKSVRSWKEQMELVESSRGLLMKGNSLKSIVMWIPI